MANETEDLATAEEQIEYKTIDSNASALDVAQALIDSAINVDDLLEISDYLKVFAYHHGAEKEDKEESKQIGF